MGLSENNRLVALDQLRVIFSNKTINCFYSCITNEEEVLYGCSSNSRLSNSWVNPLTWNGSITAPPQQPALTTFVAGGDKIKKLAKP